MKKAAILIFPGFSEFEITVATAVLRRRCDLVTLALNDQVLIGESNLQIKPHARIQDVSPEDFDAFIIPGGEDLSSIMDNEAVLNFVRELDQNHKQLAAICAGVIVLAKAGVIEHRPYTVSLYRRFRDYLGCFNEEYFRKEPIVESNHILTAQGFAFVEFGLRLGERLDAMGDKEGVFAYYRGQGDIHWED